MHACELAVNGHVLTRKTADYNVGSFRQLIKQLPHVAALDHAVQILAIGLARGFADVVGPCDLEGKRGVLCSEHTKAAAKSEVHSSAPGKKRYHVKFFVCRAVAVAVGSQLGRASELVLPVNWSNVNRFPTIWRTAASNRWPSSMPSR